MMTIREKIKAKKFYNCSHCGSSEHTKETCPNLHLVYKLPKPIRTRKSKAKGAGKNTGIYIYIKSKNNELLISPENGGRGSPCSR